MTPPTIPPFPPLPAVSPPALPGGSGPSPPGDAPPRWRTLAGAGVWLVYLSPAAGQVAGSDWPAWQRVLGGVALATFVVLYLTTLRAAIVVARRRTAARNAGAAGTRAPGQRRVLARTAALAALAMATGIGFGPLWLVTFAFVAATLAVVLPSGRAPVAIVGTAVVAELLLALRADPWKAPTAFLWLAFGVLIGGFFSLGFRRMRELMADLDRSREDNARLAVAEERLRISRDLHDLLGHSLSVIAVKSQLAERLLEREQPDRAAAEIRDVRGVARDALHEVRHVVEGYRRRPLAAEIARAEAALAAVDVRVRTTLPAEPIPHGAEDVVGFVVREASTNVLRHARARSCRIEVARRDGALVTTVTDDGAGMPDLCDPVVVSADCPLAAGHGLLGLAERLAPLGGRLRLAPAAGGGTTLEARIPLPEDRRPDDAPATGARTPAVAATTVPLRERP